MTRVGLDDPRLRAIAAEEIRGRLQGIPDAVAEPLVSAQLTAKFAGICTAHPDAVAELIMCDDAPAAYCITARTDGEVRLCDIAVAQSSRGSGLGRALLSQLFDSADAAGDAVTLSVWHDAPARSWYKRNGFVACGGDPAAHLELRRDPSPHGAHLQHGPE